MTSSTLSTRAVLAMRRDLDQTGRRLEPEDRLGLPQLEEAALEQHRRDADRVRAGHRRVLGRLHDDVARVAVVSRRGDEQVCVLGDRAARLAQQEPPQRVVGGERLHLLEDGRAPRGRHAVDDDLADLAARVALDDGDRAAAGQEMRGAWDDE